MFLNADKQSSTRLETDSIKFQIKGTSTIDSLYCFIDEILFKPVFSPSSQISLTPDLRPSMQGSVEKSLQSAFTLPTYSHHHFSLHPYFPALFNFPLPRFIFISFDPSNHVIIMARAACP